ncbi:hypothetical protein BKA70DRAFT_1239253 [Coprinopsis sp. MPI-PUGE-AT-0042]|nr:hypothetical protein BKA70DRAFT_1239253 [Coprinopsis sp. MPI-PUGE-AT-0042]
MVFQTLEQTPDTLRSYGTDKSVSRVTEVFCNMLAFKFIFLSPSSVDGDRGSTRTGNARLHGMTKVTKASLAYVATQVRFALSSTTIFSRTDEEMDSETFYNSLLEFLKDPEEQEEAEELLDWWNFKDVRRIVPERSALALLRQWREHLKENMRRTTLMITGCAKVHKTTVRELVSMTKRHVFHGYDQSHHALSCTIQYLQHYRHYFKYKGTEYSQTKTKIHRTKMYLEAANYGKDVSCKTKGNECGPRTTGLASWKPPLHPDLTQRRVATGMFKLQTSTDETTPKSLLVLASSVSCDDVAYAACTGSPTPCASGMTRCRQDTGMGCTGKGRELEGKLNSRENRAAAQSLDPASYQFPTTTDNGKASRRRNSADAGHCWYPDLRSLNLMIPFNARRNSNSAELGVGLQQISCSNVAMQPILGRREYRAYLSVTRAILNYQQTPVGIDNE